MIALHCSAIKRKKMKVSTVILTDYDDNDTRLMAIFQDKLVSQYQNVSILDFVGATLRWW